MTEQESQLRSAYVARLHGLRRALESGHSGRTSDARRDLAALRHGLVEGRQAQAYTVAFRDTMPVRRHEQDVWVLVGGLFALHPVSWSGPVRGIGASMGLLSRKVANADTVARRFTQLLGRDQRALPHDLRQAVRLLASNDVPVHYGRLLDDLVVLLGPDPRGERASVIRLSWAREYHLPRHPPTAAEPDPPVPGDLP